jgi:hypothetical protein
MPVRTAPQVAQPVIKEVDLQFSTIGYPGWEATLWLNPPGFIYDNLIAIEEVDGRMRPDNIRELEGLKEVVLGWNFVYSFGEKKGQNFPLPKDWSSIEESKNLPIDLWSSLLTRYFDEFNKLTAIPKAPEEGSGVTSSTNGENQRNGLA